MNSLAKSEVRTPLREVRLRVAATFALIMLSCDELNPVKIVCSILSIDTHYAFVVFFVIFLAVVAANAKELTYFCTKVFFHSILSIFFSSMEVLGRENVPLHGPIIFTGNHMNQFVDGAVMMVTNPHRVGFLVAEKSYHKRVIGDFAKAVGSIPVSRPQDAAKAGPGKIRFEGLRMLGEGTKFTALARGDKLRPGKSAEAYRVKSVVSDTEAVLAEDVGEASPQHEVFAQDKWTTYDILQHVDQSGMFSAVQSALAQGQCLGIFPEGGSHDRTDLLPLKAGVAAIALGVRENFGVSVPIVPVGLNYFRGHRFRGRVVVEFGAPIHITQDVIDTYHTSKRDAYQQLLQQVEDGMRSVIVTASDYSELTLIHAARRLFQPSSQALSTQAKQDVARRFSLSFKLLKERFKLNSIMDILPRKDPATGKAVSESVAATQLPEDLRGFLLRLHEYTTKLEQWGLKDYQLQKRDLSVDASSFRTLYTFVHSAVILLLASLPSLLLNAPVGAAAHVWAEREAAKDLKASRVKLQARDVLLSKKILFSLCAVPVLWISYALLLLCFTSLERRTIAVLFLSFPLFSYMGVMAVEASVKDFKDLRPAFLRLLPGFREEVSALIALRERLKTEVRQVVRVYGPQCGALYLDSSAEWETRFREERLREKERALAGAAAVSQESERDGVRVGATGAGAGPGAAEGAAEAVQEEQEVLVRAEDADERGAARAADAPSSAQSEQAAMARLLDNIGVLDEDETTVKKDK